MKCFRGASLWFHLVIRKNSRIGQLVMDSHLGNEGSGIRYFNLLQVSINWIIVMVMIFQLRFKKATVMIKIKMLTIWWKKKQNNNLILKVATKTFPLAKDHNLEAVVKITYRYLKEPQNTKNHPVYLFRTKNHRFSRRKHSNTKQIVN